MIAIINAILNIFLFVLLVRVVLSYIPAPPGSVLQPITHFFEAVTDPVLRPVRRVVPPVRMGSAAMDMSPLVVFFAILVLRALI